MTATIRRLIVGSLAAATLMLGPAAIAFADTTNDTSTPPPASANTPDSAQKTKRFNVELYVEKMEFQLKVFG